MVENGKRRSSRAPLIWLAQGAITLAFVGWLVSRINSTTIETIKAVSAPAFCTAVLIYSLSQLWCAARLWILIANGEKLPGLPRFFYLVRLTLSTFFISNFLPGPIGGDVVKAIALTRHALPLSRTVSSLLLDRLTNVAAALALSVATVGVAAPDLLARVHVNTMLAIALVCLVAGAIAGIVLLERLSNLFAYVVKALRELTLSWLKAPLSLGAALLLSIAESDVRRRCAMDPSLPPRLTRDPAPAHGGDLPRLHGHAGADYAERPRPAGGQHGRAPRPSRRT